MALTVPAGLPAADILRQEGFEVLSAGEGAPLKIGILNLMPIKITTETDLARLLASSPLPVEMTLFEPATHTSKTTPAEHIRKFYKKASRFGAGEFDGFIITGAPLERVDFEDVDYWNELCGIMDTSLTFARSTLYICWAAFAALYHRYGVRKHLYETKISGIYPHRVTSPCSLTTGFDDEFYVPHSRFIGFDREEIDKHPSLNIVAESDEAGIYIIGDANGRDFYITGHSEYSPLTLDTEYRRDLGKGMNPSIPVNYYKNDNPALEPIVRWRSHSRLLFHNWLNYYVSPRRVCGIIER